MNTIASFRKCTLTDEQLLRAVDQMTDEMYKTGKIPSRCIPARPNEDYDLILGELILRYEALTKQSDKPLVMQAEGSDLSEGAAVGQRSVGTATCGVDDNGWNCKKTTEPGGVASQCMNGCVLAGSSCEG